MTARAATPDPRDLAARLTRWFRAAQRDLPWRTLDPRTGRRDPYASLVSEIMLQQTQAARVAERLPAFLARFPTLVALAAAHENDVLDAWAGLGYYRRARFLHAAARAVVARFDGVMPADPDDLRSLPGVGAYTAGAIASVVYGRRVPAVDGNVVRVLLRVHARPGVAGETRTMRFVQRRAEALVDAAQHPGELNEALMELGATICTPRAPRCDACPWRDACLARRRAIVHRIPRPKRTPTATSVTFRCALLRDPRGRILLERAPAGDLWAGLWRLPSSADSGSLAAALGLRGVRLRPAGEATAVLSHRRVTLRLWTGVALGLIARRPRRWFDPEALPAMSSAHRRALDIARAAVR